MVRIHSGNGVHEEMDRRAIAAFDLALADVGLDAAPVGRALHDYWAWATTTTMARFHESADDVPDGMPIPRWSWDGLVEGRGPGCAPDPTGHLVLLARRRLRRWMPDPRYGVRTIRKDQTDDVQPDGTAAEERRLVADVLGG